MPGFDWFGDVTNQRDVYGEGEPIIGKTEPGRQLQAHEDSRCNVCGQQIGRKLIHVGGGAFRLDPDGPIRLVAPDGEPHVATSASALFDGEQEGGRWPPGPALGDAGGHEVRASLALEEQSYTEAPLHRECARYALSVCPGLVTAKRKNRLVVTTINREDVEYRGVFVDMHGGFHTRRPEEVAGQPVALIGLRAYVGARGRTILAEQWMKENGR